MGSYREDIERAANLLTRDLRSPLRIEELCALVGLSEFRLKQGFRTFFGTTVGAYLRRPRMERAAELLRRGDSIKSIASDLGYANSSRFAEAFRKQFGCNPSEFEA